MLIRVFGVLTILAMTGCESPKIYPTYPTAEYSSEAMMIVSKSGGQDYMQDMLLKDETTNSLDKITTGDYLLGMAGGYIFDTVATGGLYVLLMDSLDVRGWDRNNIIVFLDAANHKNANNKAIASIAYDKAKLPFYQAVKNALTPLNIYTELLSKTDVDTSYPNDKNDMFYYGHNINKFGKNKFRYVIKPDGHPSEHLLGVGFLLRDISTAFSVDRLPTAIASKLTFKEAIAVRFNYIASVRTEYMLTVGNLSLPSNMFLLQAAQANSVLPSNKIPTLFSTDKAMFFVRPVENKHLNVDIEQYRKALSLDIDKSHLPM